MSVDMYNYTVILLETCSLQIIPDVVERHATCSLHDSF